VNEDDSRASIRRRGQEAEEHRPAAAGATAAEPARGARRWPSGPRAWSRLQLGLDAALLAAASAAVLLSAPRGTRPDPAALAVFAPLALCLLHARAANAERFLLPAPGTPTAVLGALSLAAMATLTGASILTGADPLGLGIRLWTVSIAAVAVGRGGVAVLRSRVLSSGRGTTPTLVLGAGVVGRHLVERLLADARYGLRPVGFLDSDPLPRSVPGEHDDLAVPLLGRSQDLVSAIERTGARHVILAFSSEPDHLLVQTARQCRRLGVAVSLVPRLFESIDERSTLERVAGLPLLTLRPADPQSWELALKHAFDRLAALAMLVALAPVLILAGAGVALTSRGPILARQRRVGRDGRVFDVLRFRTQSAGGALTSVGRLLRASALDELPLLLGVLRGQMSLVGPRPERPEFVERFAGEPSRLQRLLQVKSGITGWAQVHELRGRHPAGDGLEADEYYVENWSLLLDLRILGTTARQAFIPGRRARPPAG
jgi:lipopolysaccharide/colanic/teichoic acid biosynthesis glycosyltransferase